MKRFYHSWRARTHRVMVLGLNMLAKSIERLHTRLLRPCTNFRPYLQCILHCSRVVDNVSEDTFRLPRIFMPKDVHLRQLAP